MRYKYIKGTLVTKHNISLSEDQVSELYSKPLCEAVFIFKKKNPKNNKEALFAILKIKVHLARQSLKKKDLTYNRYGNMYKRYNDKAVQHLALPPFQEL